MRLTLGLLLPPSSLDPRGLGFLLQALGLDPRGLGRRGSLSPQLCITPENEGANTRKANKTRGIGLTLGLSPLDHSLGSGGLSHRKGLIQGAFCQLVRSLLRP